MSRIAPSFPSNQATANVASVSTNTGFSQGDLIYYNNGDYKPMSALPSPSSASFIGGQAQATYGGTVGSVGTPVFSASESSTTDTYGASNMISCATLTNGNIVYVFRTYPNAWPAFKIVTPAGATVVAPTLIDNTSFYFSSMQIAVCALSGGGFAVGFLDYAGYPSYAIYTNAGAVTVAATKETPSGTTTYGNSSSALCMQALPNGGFVFVAVLSNSIAYYKVYTAAGGTTKTWTSSITLNNVSGNVATAARSDSSFVIMACVSAGTVNYTVYNASGNAVVSSTTVYASSQNYAFDVACLADGQTFVFGYFNSGFYARLLPASNTLGNAITLVPTGNLFAGGSLGGAALKIAPTAAGGFYLIGSDVTLALSYVYCNAAGAVQSGTNASGGIPIYLPSAASVRSGTTKISHFEASGVMNLVYAGFTYGGPPQRNMYRWQISNSTYLPVANATASGVTNPVSVTSTPGTALVNASTPTNIKYAAATTTAIPTSNTVGVTKAASTIVSTACDGLHSTTLTNGNVVITFRDTTSSRNVFAYVYSPTGTLLTTLTVGQGVNTGLTWAGTRVVALQGGKFAVFYTTSDSTLAAVVYSSTYSVLYTSTNVLSAATATALTNDGQYGFDAVGLADDRIAIAHANSSVWLQTTVLDNTLAQVWTTTVWATVGWYWPKLAANTHGGFCAAASSPANSVENIVFVEKYGATNYQVPNTQQPATSTYTPAMVRPTFLSCGAVMYPLNTTSASALNINLFDPSLTYSSSSSSTASSAVNSVNGAVGFGCTAYGAIVSANFSGTGGTANLNMYGMNPLANGHGNAWASIAGPTTNLVSVTTVSVSSVPTPWVTPGVANNVFVAWRDNNNYPTFVIVNIYPNITPTALTAGVTASLGVPIYPGTTVSTPAVQNTVLVGVAATNASAGSTGQITTNGSATLNSSYNASTAFQPFDHQQPNGTGIQGVKGTISGRNVSLMGNT